MNDDSVKPELVLLGSAPSHSEDEIVDSILRFIEGVLGDDS